MLIQCAWCGEEMGEKEPLDDERITHGICEECQRIFRNEIMKGESHDLSRRKRARKANY